MISTEQSLIRKSSTTNFYLNDLCGEAKYDSLFAKDHAYYSFFDYQQSCDCSQKIGKPSIIVFTTWSALEEKLQLLKDKKVTKYLSDKFILTFLNVNARDELDEDEVYYSEFVEMIIKNIGHRNAEIQASQFRSGSQPLLVALNEKLEMLSVPIGYGKTLKNKKAFLEWLEDNYQRFEEGRTLHSK